MKMTIARALKEKNRIIGEMNRLRTIISTRNCVTMMVNSDSNGKFSVSEEDINSKRKVNLDKILDDYNKLMEKLVRIKVAITKANSTSAEILVGLTESKSELTALAQFGCGDDCENAYGDTRFQICRYKFDSQWLEQRQKEITDRINFLQDRIDEFNAVTYIEIED